MKVAVLGFILLALAPAAGLAAGPEFIVCKSSYALCTSARCSPIRGIKGFVSCSCNVENDYSAGLKPCRVRKASDGLRLRSRYHPISNYARCVNDRPWAWCLDAPCKVDPRDPSHATCKCPVAEKRGAYVIVNETGRYDDSSCTTGMYSSATVDDLNQVTEWLKTHRTPLHPVPMKVFESK